MARPRAALDTIFDDGAGEHAVRLELAVRDARARWRDAIGDADFFEHRPLRRDAPGEIPPARLELRGVDAAIAPYIADARPIGGGPGRGRPGALGEREQAREEHIIDLRVGARSEEHTSELQSLMRHSYAVLCLKKKNKQNRTT